MESGPASSIKQLSFDLADIGDSALESINQDPSNFTAIVSELQKTPLNICDLRNAGIDISQLPDLIIKKFVQRTLILEADFAAMKKLREIVVKYVKESEAASIQKDIADADGFERVSSFRSRSITFLSERPFTFIRELQRGGFARIFHVATPESEHHFAIKTVLLSDDQDQRRDQLMIAEREARLLREVRHDGVVRCYDSFFSQFQGNRDVYCIQLQLCGASLKEVLVTRNRLLTTSHIDPHSVHHLAGVPPRFQRSLDEALALVLLHQLLTALSYLHAQVRIAHNDVTPANILFELTDHGSSNSEMDQSTFNIRLCDFGLSMKLDDAGSYEPCGTLLYVSPELLARCKGRPQYQIAMNRVPADANSGDECELPADLAKAEIYSVGIIAYELGAAFGTELERSRCISGVKGNPQYCRNRAMSRFAFDTQSGLIYRLIEAALKPDPCDRLSASQLLDLIS